MLNKVFLQGRLGSDPELRTTPNGVEVATVSIAVDRDRKDAAGERQTDWVSIVAWRQTAKFLADYFRKGRIAIVEGQLRTRTYATKDGMKRTATEVVAENLYFGDSKPDGHHGGSGAPSYGGYSAPANYGMPPASDQFADLGYADDDGELPF